MEILSEEQKTYLRTMPRWEDVDGRSIIQRCREVEEQYEFDVAIPMAEQREHIQRLQDQVLLYESETTFQKPTSAAKVTELSEFGNRRAGGAGYVGYEQVGVPESKTATMDWAGDDGDWIIFLALGGMIFLALGGLALFIAALGWAT